MKRFGALIIALALVLSMGIPAVADDEVAVSFDNTYVDATGIEMITVYISNHPELTSALVQLELGDGLELVSGKWLWDGLQEDFKVQRKHGVFLLDPDKDPIEDGAVFQFEVKGIGEVNSNQEITVSFTFKNDADVVGTPSVTKTVKIGCSEHAFNDTYIWDGETHNSCVANLTCSVCGREANGLSCKVTKTANQPQTVHTATVEYQGKTYTGTKTCDNHKVVFNNEGSEISSTYYHIGDTVNIPANPTKKADNTYTYAFAGWDKEVVACAGDATYNAQFTATYIDYTITFKDEDGNVIGTQTNANMGLPVTPPTNVPRPASLNRGWSFDKWDANVDEYQGDTTYTAKFKQDYELGNVDGKEGISDSDAVYALYHTFNPTKYPVDHGDEGIDFDGDGKQTDRDAVYLLYFTFLPEIYPLH